MHWSVRPRFRCAARLSSPRCLPDSESPVVARHFKDAGANMVGHWPAGDYQHEDSKVLCAASAKSCSRLDHNTLDVFSRLGRRIGILARKPPSAMSAKSWDWQCLATSGISCL